MVTLKIRPWENIDGLEHTKTSWRISSDVAGNDLLSTLTDSTIWLEIWYSDITVPPESIYYASAQRTLSDGTVLPWTDAVAIRNNDINTAIILHQEVIIEEPIVNIVDDSESLDIIFEASKGRFIGDGHYSTHWIIENGIGEVIYCSLNDTINLTSLTLSKDTIGYSNLNKIVLKVIQCTATGIESDIGKKILNKTKFNFTIDIDLINIDPYQDLNIPFNKIDITNIYGVKSLVLKHRYSGEIVYDKIYQTDVDGVVIPNEVLLPDTEYIIEFNILDYSINDKMIIYLKTNNYTTRSLYQDIDITYDKVLSTAGNDGNVMLDDYFTYHEMFDYNIAIPIGSSVDNVSTDLYSYKYDRGDNSLYNTNNRIVGGNISEYGDGIYARVMEGNMLLVDSMDSGNVIFYVFGYNPVDKTAVLLRSITRPLEDTPIGKTNAIVQHDIDTIYYLPVTNATKLMMYDINTNLLSETSEHPSDPRTDSIIVDLGDNKIMMVGNGDTITYIYNTTTDDWVPGISIPIEFRDKPLKVVKLLNGDSIIFRTTKDGTYDNDDILLYNHISMEFEVILSNTNNTKAFTSVIILNNGNVLLCNQDDNGGLTKTLFK